MKKVLILDDNPLNNKRYIEKVEQSYSVDKVLKLISAKRLINQHEYDYIVIDVMMPTDNYDAEDETTTGFVFYRDEIMDKDIKAQIIFWSRLEKDAYVTFWGPNPPANTHFVHKTQDNSHLKDYIDDIDKLIISQR